MRLQTDFDPAALLIFLDFQAERQLWFNEKKRLISAYDQFVRNFTKLRKTDGSDLFNPSKYNVLTYFQNQTKNGIENMDTDELDDDDDYEDILNDAFLEDDDDSDRISNEAFFHQRYSNFENF